MLALFLALSAHAAVDMRQVDLSRLKIIERGTQNAALKEARNMGLAENFVGLEMETSLEKLEMDGLNSGSTGKLPWSGHFWGNNTGGLGYRWNDPRFPEGYANGYNYIYYYSRWDQTYWNYLSPAEKYDYLTGVNPLEGGSLTLQQWNMSRDEYSRTGTVAEWEGICHGWSAASIYLPTPKKDVIFKYPQGDLYFTVDDIKAIGSLYYANAKFESQFVGWRCNIAKPRTTSDGRVLDPECFDVNPGDWHLVLTNLVGKKHEPFILDASETLEVWNHPIVDYKFTYFDPTNVNRKSKNFRTYMREFARTPNLRYGQFRSPKTVYVVGVLSTITVGTESKPGDHRTLVQKITFTYDLELDENMNIIGGEWRDAPRPDFIWKRKGDLAPTTAGEDIDLNMWQMGSANWRKASLLNSKNGVPVKLFVDKLFELSSQN